MLLSFVWENILVCAFSCVSDTDAVGLLRLYVIGGRWDGL